MARLAESNTGEPGAVISRMPGSVGGRRKRVRTRGYLAGGLPCGPSKSAVRELECQESASEAELYEAERRVLKIQTLLHRLNPVLRGWCTYFQPGVSSATFHFLRAFAWRRVIGWLRRKHPRMNWNGCASATATAAGGRPRAAWRSSIRDACGQPATATGVQQSPRHGRARPESIGDQWGLWRAGCPDNGHIRFGRRPEETDR